MDDVKSGDLAARALEALDLQNQSFREEMTMRRSYARTLLTFLGIQLLISNVAFFLYGFFGVSWDVQASVMQVWLFATVVEVISVVLVITRYLFPPRPDVEGATEWLRRLSRSRDVGN